MRTHDTGDLIIQFDVEFPTEKSLTDAQLKVIIKKNFFRFVIFEF
jgi:DnaJ-class molecular chaperone